MTDSPGGFVSVLLRFVLKLFLAVIALVFATCLIAVALVAVVFSLLKALLTWQKPAPWVVFRQVQKYSARGQWPVNGAAGGHSNRERSPVRNADVVDVEVREVPQDKKEP